MLRTTCSETLRGPVYRRFLPFAKLKAASVSQSGPVSNQFFFCVMQTGSACHFFLFSHLSSKFLKEADPRRSPRTLLVARSPPDSKVPTFLLFVKLPGPEIHLEEPVRPHESEAYLREHLVGGHSFEGKNRYVKVRCFLQESDCASRIRSKAVYRPYDKPIGESHTFRSVSSASWRSSALLFQFTFDEAGQDSFLLVLTGRA